MDIPCILGIPRVHTRNTHFINYCLSHARKFSCAVDCFLNFALPFSTRHLYLQSKRVFSNCKRFMCTKRKYWLLWNSSRTCLVLAERAMWIVCCKVNRYRVFSDIFEISTFGTLNDDIELLFPFQQCNRSMETLCH